MLILGSLLCAPPFTQCTPPGVGIALALNSELGIAEHSWSFCLPSGKVPLFVSWCRRNTGTRTRQLEQRKCPATRSGGQKSKIKGLAGRVPPEGSEGGLLPAAVSFRRCQKFWALLGLWTHRSRRCLHHPCASVSLLFRL